GTAPWLDCANVLGASAEAKKRRGSCDRESGRLQGRVPPQAGIERRESDQRIPARGETQNKPTMLPCSSTSMENAAGVLPRPGIVCMSPQSATIQPAPV